MCQTDPKLYISVGEEAVESKQQDIQDSIIYVFLINTLVKKSSTLHLKEEGKKLVFFVSSNKSLLRCFWVSIVEDNFSASWAISSSSLHFLYNKFNLPQNY